MMGKGSIILGSDPDLEVMRIKGEEIKGGAWRWEWSYHKGWGEGQQA